MSSLYNFKRIQTVPTAVDFLDIVLSKTQRKTPTVVHKAYSIGRIRQFYMRKVKFTHDTFDEKLKQILEDFPKIENIHPFYADLMNVLYDKDHYKLALGQINTARHLISSVAKDYVRLLKFGDSLYRCKQLKKAALGRMATIMRRQKDSLAYLEQVRQHLARLPSIDPNTRTLLVCGYPNVGKSSFLNKVTRADVDVQPYAFTTKSLFVGHMDYKYLRWQVIDTPGILDHPLEDRNTIEMQSITALAHLRACVLFFVDISEQCGYSVSDQVSLFHSIKPLFANKQLILVVSKIDVMRPEQLEGDNAKLLNELVEQDGVTLSALSTFTDEGVMETRNLACDILLQARVEVKMRGQKLNDVLNKINLAIPKPRDQLVRSPFIPDQVKERRRYDPMDPERPLLERDLEAENGGAGVYNIDLKKKYITDDPEWRHDIIPEILNGHNVADFIDPDIEAKLEALELEEERLQQEGHYDEDDEEMNSEDERIRATAEKIRDERKLRKILHQTKLGKNRVAVTPKMLNKRKVAQTNTSALEGDSMDVDGVAAGMKRQRSISRALSIARSTSRAPIKKRLTSATRDRSTMGLKNVQQKERSEGIHKKAQRANNLHGKKGEADRAIGAKLPKHLFSGKRGIGKTQRR